jgi:hypothetical protein
MAVPLERAELAPVTKLLFDALENGDIDTYVNAHAKDCLCVVGNMEPVVNRENIKSVSEQMFALVNKITHHVLNEWVIGSDRIVEARAIYERRDGKVINLPSVTIYTLNDQGLISFIRIYADYTPLFAG